jgi:shikimate dehydrogenase
MGHPVAHSRSPEIHAWFATATAQQLEYRKIDPGLEGFEAAVAAFRQQGGRGLNVTLPFKERALALANQASLRARLAGAANTLIFTAHGVEADNTDGAGLVTDLTVNLGWSLAQAQVLVLGAGGAVRGIVEPLLAAGVARLVIANRTPTRAVALVDHLKQAGLPATLHPALVACALNAIPDEPYSLMINATSGGHEGELPQLPAAVFRAKPDVYDLSYGVAAKPFLDQAQALGAGRVSDGLGMLVEQAAESFWRWRGVRPPTQELLSLLRAQLKV